MRAKVILLSACLLAGSAFAAQVKDVQFACGKKSCDVTFKFASSKGLPGYFQKYDAKNAKWTVAFAASEFALGEGEFEIDAASALLRGVKVFKESGKQGELLKFEWSVGGSVNSDQNPVKLAGADFKISFGAEKAKAWKLSAVAAAKAKADKQAALAAEKEAKKLAAEEKKAALLAEKEAKLQAAKDKKAADLEAKKLAAEEKKAALAAEKEAKKLAAEEKKAALQAEKERLAAEKQKAIDERNAVVSGKKAKEEAAEPKKDENFVSALIENVKEMTAVTGLGLDQFELKLNKPITGDIVSYDERTSAVTVAAVGPAKSPVFTVNSDCFVKSLTWKQDGLKIALKKGVVPKVLVRDGALILQSREATPTNGFSYWKALPTGVSQTRRWRNQADEIPASLDAFAARYEADSKKLVSASQAFYLTPVARELFVVDEEIDLFSEASENSTIIDRLSFGDKLESIQIMGVFHKVQHGSRVGYVHKRSVSFRDELSAMQTERLKQLAMASGDSLGGAANTRFASLMNEDRVTYSSYGRRDPFIEVKGLVEEGINVDQMELVGIIWEAEDPIAILAESKNPSMSYTLKEGDKVLNGKVLKITRTDVLFLIQEFGVSRRYSMRLPDAAASAGGGK